MAQLLHPLEWNPWLPGVPRRSHPVGDRSQKVEWRKEVHGVVALSHHCVRLDELRSTLRCLPLQTVLTAYNLDHFVLAFLP